MNFIDNLTEFLLADNKRLSSKAAVVVFSVLAILLVDNILDFSYSFNIDKKIDQVQKLNIIIKDSTTDSTTKLFALNLRSEILLRKNIITQALFLFKSKETGHQNVTAIILPTNAKTLPIHGIAVKNNFWFNISASGIYFFLSIFMIPLMLLTNKTTSLLQRLATGITTTFSFILFGLFLMWICSLIPQISATTWLWNYIINFVLQAIIMGFLFYMALRKK